MKTRSLFLLSKHLNPKIAGVTFLYLFNYTLFALVLLIMDQAPIPTPDVVGPSAADMVHELAGDHKSPHKTQSLAQSELSRLQMSWEADVEDAYPVVVPANFVLIKELPNPHKMVYITSLADTDTVVAAIQATLECWSVMRSIAVEYDEKTRLLVVLRGTERYFRQAISIHPDLENERILTETSMSGNHAASELPRGLMLRVVVARIKSTKTVGLVVLINHALFDNVSYTAWVTDLDSLLGGTGISRKTPHKAFAEMYYLHQTSLAAKLATDYHVRRLRGIGSMRHGIWPPSKLFQNISARAGVVSGEGTMDAVEGGGDDKHQVIRCRRYPNLAAVGRKPSTLLIAAIASLNAYLTGGSRAIFAVLLAGREWPFTNDSVARLLPSPMSVAGPTVSSTVVVVDVNDAEQVSQFLARLEKDVRLLKRYQHVPLDFAAHLEEEDRAVYRDARRQILNYVPNTVGAVVNASSDSPLRLISHTEYKVDRPINAFAWHCNLRDAETFDMRAVFHPDMFSKQQVERFAESVLDLVGFLCDAENSGKEVREIRSVLSERFP